MPAHGVNVLETASMGAVVAFIFLPIVVFGSYADAADTFTSTAASTFDDSVPSSWTCDESFYNSNDGCDCECGVWDPDCEDHEQDIYNCGATPSEPSPDHVCYFSDSKGMCELIPIPPYIKDPDFKYQHWYLGPNGANVIAAWELGITGQGVHIRVNDDGLDYTNPEFSSKLLPGWKDPMPADCIYSTHGTSCAGIAAASSNEECGVGVAFNAYVSGASWRDWWTDTSYHFLEDGACDAHSYQGLGVDVSSNSWFPDGCYLLDEPGTLSASSSSCPFLPTNNYSPCGDMSGLLQTSSPFYSWEYDAYIKCSAEETWSEPEGISEFCKWHIFIYCGSSDLHTEIGYMDPGCTDFYDFYVDCVYHSLPNHVIASLQRGTSYGRGGKGMVYVWAAGNEGAYGGNVNDVGYTNSIYTISVGAIGRDNQHSIYTTGGAAVLISAPAGDTDQKINTYETLPMDAGKCSVGGSNFVGTSFATPIVSGVVALMLEANPELGWRDVQDILIRTAVTIDIAPDSPNDSWVTNAAGLSHSYDYGFGKVDAKAAVILAQNYSATNVKHNLDLVFTKSPNSTIESVTTSSMSVLDASVISSAQHVVVYVNITHSWRGDLSLSLTSPSGVTSELINFKPNDYEDLQSTETWKFMTLRNWGEQPADLQGSWILRIEDKYSSEDHGVLHSWRLEIFGNDASNNVSGTLTAECAAISGGYSDVIGEGQCYTREKSDDELTRATPCDASTPPTNGGVGNCTGSLASGSTCQPTCNSGYTVSGTSSCFAGTLTAATCSGDPCDASTPPAHGTAGDCTNSLTSGSTCQPTCDSGYTVSGTSSCSAGTLTAATCSADPCDASTPPTNGGVGDCTNSLASGSTCQPTCDSGYTLLGTSSCDTGKLTAATCSADPCDASTPPTNGTAGDCTDSLASGSTCQPTCDSGYTVLGTSSCFAGTLTAATCSANPASAEAKTYLASVSRDALLADISDESTRERAKLLANAAIAGLKVNKIAMALTAENADVACGQAFSKMQLEASLGACDAAVSTSKRRRLLAVTAYDVTVFVSPATMDETELAAALESLAAEGITATSTETDPIEELGAIPGIDDSRLESFAADAAVAAEAEGSSDAKSIKVMHSLAAAVGISLILAY